MMGKRVTWFSHLPDSPMGRTALNAIRQYGVHTDDARMGLYFLE
ncbi:MAG: hypothetical protein ACPG7F_17565 [Aggregatilineales bacterium]